MAETSFKERVRQEMIKSARQYKNVYVDYEYLICSASFKKNPYYIIDAKEDNFLHLTGVHAYTDAYTFFVKCYDGTLTENDFDFIKRGQDEKATKGTVRRKIQVLQDMATLMQPGIQIEEEFRKNHIICSLAAADNSCTLGFTKTNKVRPMSLIKGNELRNPVMVDVILRKTTGSTSFDEVVVGDATTLSQFMGKIDRLVSRDLFSDL